MNSFAFAIILLPLSLSTATNLTQVFEWPDGMDYEWPSEAKRTQALEAGTYKPENISPRYMAVFGKRIFLSLHNNNGIPATLVSLPTSSACSASPKLTPVPSWDMHGEREDCNKIQSARGLEVDSIGRLWVLDSGRDYCNPKLWTIDLVNNNHIKLIHLFTHKKWMLDLVLDETPNGTLAYISREDEQNVYVFSLEKGHSWTVDTPEVNPYSIALSKEEPKQLYLSNIKSNELFSISVAVLRNRTQTTYPKLVGNWTAHHSKRMLMDNHGIIYSAFWWRNYISSWNTSKPFKEQRFHEVGELKTSWPFTFALDSSGTFWMTECNETFYTKPKCRLLKAAVGAKSNMSEPPETGGRFTGKGQTDKSTNPALIGSLAFFLVLSCIINLWFALRMRKSKNSNEHRNAEAAELEMLTLPNSVSQEIAVEGFENYLYDAITAPAPSQWL